MAANGRIIVFGGRGALGATCVNHFKANRWWVANVDFNRIETADENIVVEKDQGLLDHEKHVMSELHEILEGEKVDAVVCTAGGLIAGNAAKNLCKQTDVMWRTSVWNSVMAAATATKYLMPGGVLALTGAKAALGRTPNMMGYGLSKAAVHQLTISLSGKDSGMPEDSLVVALLPVSFDTEMNRRCLPDDDLGTRTPLLSVAQLFEKWIKGHGRPPNGSLVSFLTKHNKTSVLVVYNPAQSHSTSEMESPILPCA